ncbi:MAG: head-tail connector protein [Novosphingobium sp.]|nr:head-tail connector protein [Novosphingobium sp.]
MIKVITAPTAEPLTLEEVKTNLRIVNPDEDDDLSRMIRAARQMAEERLNRALMPQTLAFGADGFCGALKVPRPPLRTLTGVSYTDTSGVVNVMADSAYVLNDFIDPPAISPAAGTSWPATQVVPNAVVVQYQAGYADAASVPEPIRQWMLLAIGAFYEHRSMVNEGQTYALPDDFCKWLLQPYVVYQ